MNTRNKIFRAILFLLLLVWLLKCTSYIVRSDSETKDRFAGFYGEEKNSVDVILMGSSAVHTSFIPAYMWEKYGFTSYPLSTNSQRPKATRYLIEESLKTQSPALYVIELRNFTEDDEVYASDEAHIRETVDNMRYSPLRIRAINALTEEYEDKLPFYLDIIKYHSNISTLLKPKEWAKFRYKTHDSLKGFQIITDAEPYRSMTPDLYTEDTYPIEDKQEEILKDLLKYLKDNDLDALFVVTPRDELEHYNEMMNYMSDMVEAEGFRCLNMNYMYDEMGFDYKTDIGDGAHANLWGAVKCSELLGRYIRDNYDIDREYPDRVKKDWDSAYDFFEEELSAAVPAEVGQ